MCAVDQKNSDMINMVNIAGIKKSVSSGTAQKIVTSNIYYTQKYILALWKLNLEM